MRCRLLRVMALMILVLGPQRPVAAADPPGAGRTRELLAILLGPQVGNQLTSDKGPCSTNGRSPRVRDDVLYFLSLLTDRGSITSQCEKSGAGLACHLVIGRAASRGEDVWTRTYVLDLDKSGRQIAKPVECYTIP
jgi:hypothetical protein